MSEFQRTFKLREKELYLQHSHEIETKYIGFHFIYKTSVPRARMIAVVCITEATLKIPD